MDAWTFCSLLARRICRELSGYEDKAMQRWWWCDGVVPGPLLDEDDRQFLSSTIWIGPDGQTEMSLKMRLLKRVKTVDEIDWAEQLPPVDAMHWLLIDTKRKLVEVDLTRAQKIRPE